MTIEGFYLFRKETPVRLLVELGVEDTDRVRRELEGRDEPKEPDQQRLYTFIRIPEHTESVQKETYSGKFIRF